MQHRANVSLPHCGVIVDDGVATRKTFAHGGEPMRDVIRASSLGGFRNLVEELGGDADGIARDAGLDLDRALQPDKLIPARNLYELMNLAAERLKRKDFGLLWGERSDPSGLGPLFISIANASTGREAIASATRFLHIHTPVALVYVKQLPGREQDLVGIRNFVMNPPCLAQMFERRVAGMHKLLALICGKDYRPSEIWLPHAQVSPVQAYERVFGIAPRFEAGVAGIVVNRHLLDAARPGANPTLQAIAEAYLRSLGPPANDSLAAETFNMVRELIRSSDVTAGQTARALGLHERTLQRRLKEEGASFERIKDDVRRAIAETMLADLETPLTEIAMILHYGSSAAFTRSCRRWFGEAPRIFRKRLAQRGVSSPWRTQILPVELD